MSKSEKAASGQELDVKKSTQVGQVLDYGDMAGSGLEDVSTDDMVIPFVNVLQGLSPEIEEMEGAKPGMLFNKGTQELIKGEDGFLFLPVQHTQLFVEWKPREQGGGLIGRHQKDSEVIDAAKRACAERGEDPRFTLLWTGEPEKSNQLRQTYYLYGYVLEDTDEGYQVVGQALISFTGTKIKVYKNWMTSIMMLKKPVPPLYAHPIRVSTFKDSNPKGEFYNFKLRPAKGSLKESRLNPGVPAEMDIMLRAQLFAKELKVGEKYKMGDEGGDPKEEAVPF